MTRHCPAIQLFHRTLPIPPSQHFSSWAFDQSTSRENEIQCTKIILSIITFKTADLMLSKLEHLVYGNNVEEREWSKFIIFCIRVWRFCIVFSLILLYVCLFDHTPITYQNKIRPQVFYYALPEFPRIALVSTSLAIMSITTATVLIHSHRFLVKPTSNHAVDYLTSVIFTHFGYQPAALIFSLPLWTFIYAYLFFFLKWAKFLYS